MFRIACASADGCSSRAFSPAAWLITLMFLVTLSFLTKSTETFSREALLEMGSGKLLCSGDDPRCHPLCAEPTSITGG